MEEIGGCRGRNGPDPFLESRRAQGKRSGLDPRRLGALLFVPRNNMHVFNWILKALYERSQDLPLIHVVSRSARSW